MVETKHGNPEGVKQNEEEEELSSCLNSNIFIRNIETKEILIDNVMNSLQKRIMLLMIRV